MSINSNKNSKLSLGGQGFEMVTGTGAGTAGPWVAIQMIADTVFSAYTGSDVTGTVTGVTFPAGQVLYGDCSAFTLTSGTVCAYKGKINV